MEVRFAWQAQGIVSDVWTRKFSWQGQGIVRLRVVARNGPRRLLSCLSVGWGLPRMRFQRSLVAAWPQGWSTATAEDESWAPGRTHRPGHSNWGFHVEPTLPLTGGGVSMQPPRWFVVYGRCGLVAPTVRQSECPQECSTRVPYKSVPQECRTRVSYKTGPSRGCPARVLYKSFLQGSPIRVSHKSVPQECPTRESYKSVSQSVPQDPQECHTRVSHKSDKQECPTRMSCKSVPQQCPTGVSCKSATRVPYKIWPTRLSDKAFPQQCPTRVFRKSVPQE